ncbi:MAG: hypothetical protein R2939_20110 [Kofleriaceae bacterium]
MYWLGGKVTASGARRTTASSSRNTLTAPAPAAASAMGSMEVVTA